MKKIYTWYIVSAVIMLGLYIFYKNGMIENLVFCKNDNNMLLLKSITAQFMHFSLFHYICNIVFSVMLLKDLKDKYCFGQIILTEVISMLFVSAALLLFGSPEMYYAGFSGIVLGWYALLGMKNIVRENNNSKKAELIIDGVVFIIISVIIPGVSALMHLAGIISGVICFFIFDNCKIKKL